MPEGAQLERTEGCGTAPAGTAAERVFAAFLDRIEAGERPSFGELCAAHPELAADLGRRHRWLERMGLLNGERAAAPAVPPDSPAPEERIGDFRLLRLLGTGGMGQVWEAEQSSLRRRVALKLLRSDTAVSAQGLARFRREAEAGGRLSHPGLVAVHSIGESGGRVHIAQELVPGGSTLRSFLDAQRGGGELPREYYRFVADFFARVADALQVAHEAGVVHRDVKPQNILIAPGGRPKVADFGLAKVAGSDTLTGSGEVAGTCAYMSPEQALGRNQELGPASDQFSLGATLYEALTLRRAFEGDTGHQIAAKILLDDPVEPRAVRSRVPHDLAVVCGKMLEKRPEDRYPSMGALAEDLRRHLADEPISARAPGPLRRARKWAARHRGKAAALAVAAAAAVVVGVLLLENVRARGSLEVAVGELEQAQGHLLEEKLRAEEEAAQSNQVLAYLTEMFAQENPDRARGEDVTVREVLDRESQRILRKLEQHPGPRARLMHAMGLVYRALGRYEQASPLLEGALALRRDAGEGDLDLPVYRLDLGLLYRQQRRGEEALELISESIGGLELAYGPEHRRTLDARAELATTYRVQGRLAEAETHYRAVLEDQLRVLGPASDSTWHTQVDLAVLCMELGRYAEAEPLFLESLDRYLGAFGASSPRVLAVQNSLGVLYSNLGRYDEARELHTAALEGHREVLGPRHPQTLASLGNLASVHFHQGRNAEAAGLFREALDAHVEEYGADSPKNLGIQNNLAMAYVRLRRPGEAEPLLADSVRRSREVFGDRHASTLTAIYNLGLVYALLGRVEEAEPLQVQAFDGFRDVLGPGHPSTLEVRRSLGALCARMGRLEEAETHHREAYEGLRDALGDDHPLTRTALGELALCCGALGRREQGLALARRLLELTPADDPRRERHQKLLTGFEEAVE